MDIEEKVVLVDTPEKFAEMAKIIVPPFLEVMQKLVELEDKAHIRSQEMEKEKIEMGIPSSIMHPGEMEFFNNYRDQYRAVLSTLCTKKLLARPFGVSIHHPAR